VKKVHHWNIKEAMYFDTYRGSFDIDATIHCFVKKDHDWNIREAMYFTIQGNYYTTSMASSL